MISYFKKQMTGAYARGCDAAMLRINPDKNPYRFLSLRWFAYEDGVNNTLRYLNCMSARDTFWLTFFIMTGCQFVALVIGAAAACGLLLVAGALC